ncbi:MAG: VCBS domain-containing protein, partial [Gallionella sp.]
LSDSFTVSSADGTTTTVKITIKGTNDPAILGSATISIDETNAPLSTSGTLSISDVDSPQTFITRKKIAGVYGNLSIDTSGRWTYVANSSLDYLGVGQSVSDSFTVSSSDGTTTTVQVTINGTNDAAILSSAIVSLDETDIPLSTSGQLSIKDLDSSPTFVAESHVSGVYGIFNIDSAGRWTYVANSAFNELNEGQSVTDSFTVASTDGTTTTVQVTIDGNNDPAVLSQASVALDETDSPLNFSGTLSIYDVDSPETFVEQKSVAGKNGTFNIDSAGRWTYVANSAFDELNVGQSVGDTFTVASADGTTTTVQVTINGTNDPAILGSAAIVLDETNEPLSTSGTLSIRDVDSPATFVAQSNFKGYYGTFNIDSAGAWTYLTYDAFDSLLVGESISESFTVASADGTTTSVQVTINGTNEAAILGSADVVLTETNAILSTGGILTISDVDSPETFVAQNHVAGTAGTFNIDSAGRWTYVANSAFDNLNVDQSVSDTFIVSSADGTTTTVQVTIKGTNDAAILGSASVALDETNAPLRFSGKLSIRDVDSPETFVAQNNVAGANGIFNIDATGAWTYLANSAFDELNVGQSVGDKFTVASADGTPTSVQVTINGTNDPAVMSSPNVSLTETNEALRTTGKVSIRDVDSPETIVARTNIRGSFGTFNIDSAGAWTYVAYRAFDELNVGQSVSDSFWVTSADGTTTKMRVTINGSNDPASLSPVNVILTETNSPRRTGGNLDVIDVDSPMAFVAQSNVAGTNGKFNIDSAGRWTYVANSAFDSLDVGQSVSDSFIVISKDGTASSVKITIEGSEESRFDGVWVGGKFGINRSNLNDLVTRTAPTYGIEEGNTWKVGILQVGIYGFLEFNNTATGPINYGSTVFGMGAKLGIPTGKWQPYGKLGYARTSGSEAAEIIGASHVYRGLGIEYKLSENWSIAGEYSRSNGNTTIQNIDNKLINKNITVGLNYYFGLPKPILAPALAPARVQAQEPSPAETPQDAPAPAVFAPVPAPAPAPAFGPTTAPAPDVTPAFGPATTPSPPVTPAFGPTTTPSPAPAPAPAFTPAFGPAPSPSPAPAPAPAPAK